MNKNSLPKQRNVDELEEALLLFQRKLLDDLHREAERIGFSVTQMEALRYIAQKGNPTMKDIAKYLKITPPSATVAIEAMCKKLLVAREVDEGDRRTVRIIPTPKAWKLFTSLHAKKETIINDSFSKLNKKEKHQLVALLKKVISQ